MAPGAILRRGPGFVDAVPFANWLLHEVRAVLYAVARDNEIQHLAREIRSRKPESSLPLSELPSNAESGMPSGSWPKNLASSGTVAAKRNICFAFWLAMRMSTSGVDHCSHLLDSALPMLRSWL